MLIGCPKERKDGEKRVALIPENIPKLLNENIEVLIETNAGLGCGYKDEDYLNKGAKIVSQKEVWESELIIKVKEPQKEEYQFFKENQIIFGYLHLAANEECVSKMLEKNITAIAAETIKKDGIFNLLKPVSQIAGRRSLFLGIHYLEEENGGKGILLSGTEVVLAGKVLIIGGGEVGINACDMALAIGCEVIIAELNESRIEYLKKRYENKKIRIIKSTEENIQNEVSEVDVLISTILIPGSKAPKVVTKKITDKISAGSVVIDVSADQGGSIEILKEVTSHQNPIKVIDEVIYYAVPNMPGAVPKTSSKSIQKSIDYIIEIKKQGLESLISDDSGFKEGIQIKDGKITYQNLKNSYKGEL